MYLLSGVEVSVSVPTVRCRGLCNTERLASAKPCVIC